jgi:hypothetical protein
VLLALGSSQQAQVDMEPAATVATNINMQVNSTQALFPLFELSGQHFTMFITHCAR